MIRTHPADAGTGLQYHLDQDKQLIGYLLTEEITKILRSINPSNCNHLQKIILVNIAVGERDRAKIVQMMISVIMELMTRYLSIAYSSFSLQHHLNKCKNLDSGDTCNMTTSDYRSILLEQPN